MSLYFCCERRIRTFTRGLANEQIWWSIPAKLIRSLSHIPHPRDKRAWLPVSSPHSIITLSEGYQNSYRLIVDGLIIHSKLSTLYEHPPKAETKKWLWGKDSNLHGVVSKRIRFNDTRSTKIYTPFILKSPPPRQEGMAANFITSQYLRK